MVATHHRSARVGDLDVFYREAGDSALPTVVLLHGAPSSSYMFRNLIPKLSDRYHVIAPDYIGFGFSSLPPVAEFDYTFDRLADVVQALLDGLGLGQFAMYVQDYGAPIGWRLALREPDRVAAIISQNGNAYEEGFHEGFWKAVWAYGADQSEANAAPLKEGHTLEKIRWQYTHGVADPSLIDPDTWHHDTEQVRRPGNLRAQLALLADYHNNVTQYPQVHEYFRAAQVPLLAVWGANDQIFAPDGARAFTRDLPDAQVHLLDGGHFLLESHLDQVTGLIRNFLATLPALAAA